MTLLDSTTVAAPATPGTPPVSVSLSSHASAAPPLPKWALGPFRRPAGAKPILQPNPASHFHCPMRGHSVRWQALHAFNPAAIVKDEKVFLLYRAEDDTGSMCIGAHTSRLGLAVSSDGLHFSTHPEPVLFPDLDAQRPHEWDGGCEDPRIVEGPNGLYVATYTQWARKVPQLAIATSTDLLRWQKHGSAFTRLNSHCYADLDIKAGSIVTSLQDGRLQAAKLLGKYWMYWGEHAVRLAWSEDLIHWRIVEDAPGVPHVVLRPEPGTFDSALVEAGPPALLTDHGIVLLYCAKNDGRHSIPNLGLDAYAGGQALFDPAHPGRLLARLDTPFVQPQLPWERTGQYGAGTTFIEGLVYFQNRWLLYYGCADSMVGVVISD